MNIKLISLSGIDGSPNSGFVNHPPLALAIFKAFLKGHSVGLDDLGIRLIHEEELLQELFSLGFHNDPGAADDYLAGRRQAPAIDRVFEKILAMVELKNARLVGLSVPHNQCLATALVLAKKIKEKTGTEIVLGGFSFVKGIEKDFFRKYPFVDHVSFVKSFRPFLDLVEAMEKHGDVSKIHGMACKGFIKPPEMGNDRVDELPRPDFDTLPLDAYRNIPRTLKQFFRYNAGRELALPYYFMGGCIYNCSFCGRNIKDKRVNFKPVARVAGELAFLAKKYRTNCFYFLNNAVNLSDKYLNEFCDEIIKKRVRILWSDSAKPKNLDKALLLKMSRAGCISLTWGVESGNEELLLSINKQHTAVSAAQTLRHAHEAGIWNRVNLIVGYPGETESQFRDTLDFIRDNIDFIDTLEVHKFFLSTPSIIASNPEKYGIKVRDNLRNEGEPDFKCYGFDEVNGVKWEEKQKQLERRHRATVSFFQKLKNGTSLPNLDLSYNLFYLYKKFKTKAAVLKQLKKAAASAGTRRREGADRQY
ncbi:MAG TPA: hypothetical protein DCZ92_06725 [Elusimicrobia bacterium]|nr:MAG: hypothetical protein A2016_05240 [Elusimicrobia bacterium GWF2_62_30]HBA60499.1 hypothetical protein [Elusimicrobiota bacterium]